MKKYTVILLILFASTLCFAYSKQSKTIAPDEVVKTGHIKVYGNDPFTFIGLACDNGEIYTIKASDKVISELSDSQGFHIEIKGFIDNPDTPESQMNKLKNGYLTVKEWKKIDK